MQIGVRHALYDPMPLSPCFFSLAYIVTHHLRHLLWDDLIVSADFALLPPTYSHHYFEATCHTRAEEHHASQDPAAI